MNNLEYGFVHLGINANGEQAAAELAELFGSAFGLPFHNLPTSIFVGRNMEVMKKNGPGKCGHIAIGTNDIEGAILDLQSRGYLMDMSTAMYKGDCLNALYLRQEFGGFAVHLLQNQ